MSDLKRVVDLGQQLVDRQADLAAAEEKVAAIKAEVTRLEREDIPALMAECGITEVKLTCGKTITVKEDCDARISEANRPAAFRWLLDHGFGGLIKTLVTMQFGKGEHDDAAYAANLLQQQFADRAVSLDESVHPQTLRAFVKERMTAGEPVPMDLFGVFPYSKAVISNGR